MAGASNSRAELDEFSLKVDWRNLVEEIDAGVVVPDACVLLHPYRLPVRDGRHLLDALWGVQDRLWVPEQVMAEVIGQGVAVTAAFQKEVANSTERFRRQMNEAVFSLRRDLRRWRVDGSEVRRAVQRHKDTTDTLLQLAPSYDWLTEPLSFEDEAFDPIAEEIRRLTTGRVGPAPSSELRECWREDSIRRIRSNLPPSYADRRKKAELRHSDCVIWHQILQFGMSQTERRPIVFVTLDLKDTGWVEHRGGIPVGAHSDLVEELDRAAKVPFFVLSTPQLQAYVDHSKEKSLWECDLGWSEDQQTGLLRPVPSFLLRA